MTTLVLVLTVTGFPSAGPFCIAWCDDHTGPAAAAAGCHHQTTTRGAPVAITGAEGCEAPVQYMPFVREEVQPVSSGLMPSHAALPLDLDLSRTPLRAAFVTVSGTDHMAPPVFTPVLRL